MSIISKLIATLMALVMSIFGSLGLVGNVSDDYTEGKYKNVILLIGDGMSFNTIAATEAITGIDLVLNDMPVKASSDIDSFMNTYTDSAAGGTALATGVRVINSTIGVYPFDLFSIADMNVPMNLSELAKANGMAAGVVTTDQTSGATPSAFSAHTFVRTNEGQICKDQLASDLDLIWGGDTDSINRENAEANGWTYIDNQDDMFALEAGSRSIAQFNFDDLYNCKDEYNTPSIVEMTEKAIDILSADEDGFFLMVEGACIDKNAHNNVMEGVTKCTVEFDKAVAAALEFAEKDGETLVVVTADHGTGGITLNEETGEYCFTSGDHDKWDVPLFVSAEDAGFTSDILVKNREIPVQIARVLGFDENEFPARKAK